MNASRALSLEDIIQQSKDDPYLLRTMLRYSCKNYDEFLQTLLEDIEDAIVDLTKKRDQYNKSDSGEDLITLSLVSYLNGCGYDASHDTKDGGHIDLTVRNPRLRLQWKAEAKIWNGPSYIQAGWEQLTERYLTGGPHDSHAGILIYCFKKNALVHLKQWLAHLQGEHISHKHEPTTLRAETICNLPSSGTPVVVKHFMINLWFPTSKHRAAAT